MALVFAAIAPHCGLAIAEACSPEERSLATSTRAGMEELGRLFAAAGPEAVVVATPHKVHLANPLGGRLISYEAPTYLGMLTAAYRPSR